MKSLKKNILVTYKSTAGKLRVMLPNTWSPYFKYPRNPMAMYRAMTMVIPRDRSPHLLLKSHSSAALFFNGITCKQVNLQVMTLKYHKLIYRLFDLIFLLAWKHATSNYCIIKLILIIVFYDYLLHFSSLCEQTTYFFYNFDYKELLHFHYK